MATIGRGAAVVQMLGGKTMKGRKAQLAWRTVHLALLPTNEDRAKAVVDWTGSEFTHQRVGPDQRRARTSRPGRGRSARRRRARRRRHDTRRWAHERNTGTTGKRATRSGNAPADVFVIFGITGDLAKVMTFHSLYRLEQRGLLDCPIVGVAVDDWTVEQLVAARPRVDRRHRRAARRGGLRPLRGAALVRARATSRTPPRTTRVGGAIEGAQTPVFYLEIPPSLFGTVVKGLAEAGLTTNARVVVEKPFGHDQASAREPSPRSCTSTSTSRSSSASTTTSGRWASRRSSTSGSRTRCSSRSGTGTTSSPSRSRWRRTSASRTVATSTTPSARSATSSSTT